MPEATMTAAAEFAKRSRVEGLSPIVWSRTHAIVERLTKEANVLNEVIWDAHIKSGNAIHSVPQISIENDYGHEDGGLISVMMTHHNSEGEPTKDAKDILRFVPHASHGDVYATVHYARGFHQGLDYREIRLNYDLDTLSKLMGQHSLYMMKREESSPFYSPGLVLEND